MNLILLGAPGAGKGTQAEILCDRLNIPTISTGNMIREALKSGTEMGKKAQSYIESGALVPDEVIARRVSGRRVCPGCGNSYHVETKKPQHDGVCDRCGTTLVQRKDDQPATVEERLRVYHEQTEPLRAYYAAAGKLLTVDGQQDITAVAEQTLALLKG